MSPVELMVPLITISALMMEGADSARVRLACTCGAAGRTCGAGPASLLLLENMAASLDEVVGISYGVIIPDFIMHMGSGAAARGAHPSQGIALGNLCSHPDADDGEVPIACVDAVAVVNFHHVAVTAADSRKHHHAGGGGVHN